MKIKAVEFSNAREAMQHAKASGRGPAIQMDGKYLVVRQAEADRLAAAGKEFAYLCNHAGRIVTVPVN